MCVKKGNWVTIVKCVQNSISGWHSGEGEGYIYGDSYGDSDAGALDTERPGEADQGCQDLPGLGVSGKATFTLSFSDQFILTMRIIRP